MKKTLIALSILIAIIVYGQSQQIWQQMTSTAAISGKIDGAVVLRDCNGYADRTQSVEGISVTMPNENKIKYKISIGTFCELTYMESGYADQPDASKAPVPDKSMPEYIRVIFFENNQGGSKKYIWLDKKDLKIVTCDCKKYSNESYPLIKKKKWVPEFITAATDACRELGISPATNCIIYLK